MPYSIKKVKPDKRGRRWAIYNKDTGRVVGRSTSKRNAGIAASMRNRGHK